MESYFLLVKRMVSTSGLDGHLTCQATENVRVNLAGPVNHLASPQNHLTTPQKRITPQSPDHSSEKCVHLTLC